MRQHLLNTILIAAVTALVGCHPLSAPSTDSGGSTLSAEGTTPCGTASCADGQVCCNASCGICAPPDGVCIQLACDPATVGKTCSDITCEGDETCMQTRGGPQCVAREEDPCSTFACPANAACEVVEGRAACAPVEVDPGEAPDDAGTVVFTGGSSCAATLCPVNTYCDDISGTAKCIKAPSCERTRCEPGQHCELQEVQCIRAPCPPQPACVPDESSVCAAVLCPAGTRCEPREVQCVQAPCPPIAECVPFAGAKCGKNTCGPGTYCCNESCGICAPKDGACTQQFCGDAQ